MSTIHETAIVSQEAQLGDDVVLGPFSVVEAGAVIGDRTKIGPHVLIRGNTIVGADNDIHAGAVLGGPSQTVHPYDGPTWLRIGDGNVIRECVTFSRGFSETTGHTTVVGSNGYYMANCHVGHDCVVGDHVVMANSVALAGHVLVEDKAIIGGLTGVHQYSRIGTLSFVGGMSRMALDAAPYTWAAGSPAVCIGLNTEGLKRNGVDENARALLKKAFRIIFRSKLSVAEAVARVREEVDDIPEVAHLVQFMETTKRGVTRARVRK